MVPKKATVLPVQSSPFDYLKDLEFRKKVTSSFCAMTREQAQRLTQEKGIKTEIGKYDANYSQIDNHPKQADFG